jgi:hypothetical protein
MLDSSLVRLTYPSSASANWLVTAVNLRHFIFRQITFSRTAPSGGSYELFVMNNAQNVSFENCRFETTNRYYGTALRYNSSLSTSVSNCHFNMIKDGIVFAGSGTPSKLKVNNNVFNNIGGTAVVAGTTTDTLQIRGNHIYNDSLTIPDGSTSGLRGIIISYCTNTVDISYNTIQGRFTVGINLTCLYATAAKKVKVHNNFISVGPGFMGGASQGSVGIYLYSCNYIELIHNSIYMYNIPTSNYYATGYLAVELNPVETYQNLIFKNNLIVADSIDAIFGFPTNWNTSFLEFDHNNIYRYDSQTPYSSAAGWPGSWNANTTAIQPIFYSRDDLHVLNPQLAMGTAVWTPVTDDNDGDLRNHPTVGADEGNFDPINIGSIITKVETACDSAKVSVKVFNYCLDTITKFDIAASANSIALPAYTWNGTLYPGDTTAWIVIGKFPQVNGQNYTVETSTQLPNDETDLNQFNDTSTVNYHALNPVIDLGTSAVGCLPDSLLLTHNQTAIFTNYLWDTGLANDTLFVSASGTYTLSATNQFGCVSSDSIEVLWGGGQVPQLSQLGDTLYTSVTSGTNNWYMNELILSGETDTTLTISTYGDYFVLNTDDVGCTVSSDTLQILNYRDVGVIEIYPVHSCTTTALTADVKNFSTQVINSFKIDLLLDGILQNTITWNGTVASGDTVFAIDLGSVPHTFGVAHQISVTTYLPNTATDFVPSNDDDQITYTLTQDPFDLGPDVEICPGDIALLELADSTLFNTFSWENGGNFASQSTSVEGEYFLEGTDAYSCIRLDSVTVYVGGDEVPVITMTGNILTSSQTNGNQWYLDGVLINGATGNSYVASVNGTYSVSFTDTMGCTTNSSTVNVLGNGLAEEQIGLFVYPNPTNGVIKVQLDGSVDLAFDLIDLTGKVLMTGILHEGVNTLSLDLLADGMYSLRYEGQMTAIRIVR